jgi:hypothetical protein
MLAASPTRLFRRSLPVLAISLFYGCSEPSAPPGPRAGGIAHPLVAPVITVTNTDDAGPGSLRQAVLDAPDAAVIQFDAAVAGQTIVLTSGNIAISRAVVIEGPVPGGITISGGLLSRAFFVTTAGNATLRNLTITDGRDKFAGGVLVEGAALLDHALVANNEATSGAGGGIFVSTDGKLLLVNSTVSGNVTTEFGGGIGATGDVTVRSSTVAFNFGERGGGVALTGGSLSLRNSIISNNVDTAPGDGNDSNCRLSGVAPALTGQNIADDASCGPSMDVSLPKLAPLANAGGPTKTHALLSGSSAIDRGLLCSETTDQRYVSRPQGSTCDVGAFEFNDFGIYTITIGPNAAVNTKTGIVTITGTIACSTPTTLPLLDVEVSQTQKVTGRFTTIVKGKGSVGGITCGGSPSSWSVAIGPQSGKFEPGSAIGTATTAILLGGFLPATVTSTLKLFQVK